MLDRAAQGGMYCPMVPWKCVSGTLVTERHMGCCGSEVWWVSRGVSEMLCVWGEEGVAVHVPWIPTLANTYTHSHTHTHTHSLTHTHTHTHTHTQVRYNCIVAGPTGDWAHPILDENNGTHEKWKVRNTVVESVASWPMLLCVTVWVTVWVRLCMCPLGRSSASSASAGGSGHWQNT